MTIDDIKELIVKDETRTLELKKSTGELHKGMETACAFLNSDGGWLLFGITPSLKIDGQNVTDNTRQEIANALRKIEPAIDVEVQYIELPQKPDFYVIAICFDSNNFKNGPYSFDGRAFYKVESTTALMPRQMYEERLKLSNPRRFSWENTPNAEITVEDIDTELLYQTLHDGISSRRIHASAMTLQNPEKIMLKLGVARKDGTMLNAANVLFGKEPSMLHTRGEAFQSPPDSAVTPSEPSSQVDEHPQSVSLSPQDRVLEFCRTPRSITEIANMLGVKDKKWVRKKYVSPLVGSKLQMTIPEKPNSQNQKYKTIE